jgi:putative phage-type endonuclease
MLEELTRDEWLERRRNYIGGSDAAAALGLSPYTSRLELWLDKRGKAADIPTAVMERGQLLEDVVAELYRRLTGHETQEGGWLPSDEHYYMAATPDLLDVTAGAIVQIKTHSSWGRHRWGSETAPKPPHHEVIQCQHELAVTRSHVNYLVVLFADESAFRGMVHMRRGGFSPQTIADHVEALMQDGMAELLTPIRIDRDESLIADIVEGERQFWEEHVLAGVAPPDASVPQKSEDIIDADSEQTAVLELLRKAKADENAAVERYKEYRVRVEGFIGDASGIVAPGVAKVSYKAAPAYEQTNWAGVAQSLAEWLGRDAPQLETWESLARSLGLEAGDDLFDVAVEENTETMQPKRIFRPRFR